MKKTNKKSSSAWSTPTFIFFFLFLAMFAAFAGVVTRDLQIVERFSSDQEIITVGDNTFMQIDGAPVEIIILNDENCSNCDTSDALTALRNIVSPALTVSTIDISSTQGEIMVADFEVKSLPAYFFGDGIEDISVEDQAGNNVPFLDQLAAILKTHDNHPGKYYILPQGVNFRIGKFIEAPTFADLDTEPHKGDGPVKIIEFNAFECGFCKRFHDDNGDTIDTLVEEGKITYVLKDFPLRSPISHMGANCALEVGGMDAYWDMHDRLFDDRDGWIASPDATDTWLRAQAGAIGLNTDAFNTCMDNPTPNDEIAKDQEEGRIFGVRGTPAFFIGGQFISGAIGPDRLQQVVAEEYAKATSN